MDGFLDKPNVKPLNSPVFALIFTLLLSAPPRLADPGPVRQPRLGLAAQPGGRTRVFFRPVDCVRHRKTRTRITFRCRAEDRLEVRFSGKRILERTPLSSVNARGHYPASLAFQWRRCPFKRVRALDAIARPYEDPDVGRCYLLRNDTAELPRDADRVKLLPGLHPYLRDSIARVVARARAEGHRVRVISGLRLPKRRGGKWRGRSWHSVGLAVDINLAHHRGLKSASAAYEDGSERAIWDAMGRHGEQLGLKWLGHKDAGEIFHFEWHPGWPGRADDPLYQQLNTLRHRGGNEAVWRELRYDRRRKTAFKWLRD